MNSKKYSFKYYIYGALVARTGDKMTSQAVMLLAIAMGFTMFGPAIFAALTLSAAVGGPLLGVVLDRAKRPGRILASALCMYALGITLLTFLLGQAPNWLIIVVALATGFFASSITGGWSSRLKTLVSKERLSRASAMDALTYSIAGLVGPMVAGLLGTAFGAHWAVLGVGFCLVMTLPAAWKMPERTAPSKNISFSRNMLAGFRIILANKVLRGITLLSVISYVGIGMVWVGAPLFGKEQFGNAGFGGIMLSAMAVGSLVAAYAYARWLWRYKAERIAVGTAMSLAITLSLLSVVDSMAFVLVTMFFAGMAEGAQLATVFTLRNQEAPERFRSQVFTTGASLKITAVSVGSAIVGYLAAQSLAVVFLVAALMPAVAMTSFMLATKKLEIQKAGMVTEDR